ncbi:MAG: DUF2029 domain-containing protein [Verrucomicrobia bacterium]|nr:DUF2029 domain-containing protein [Verrucomicrobiota bacterium]
MRNRWNLLGFITLSLVFGGMCLYLILNPTRTGVVPNYRFASQHWWTFESMYPGGTHGYLYLPQFAVLFSLIDWIKPPVLGEIVWRALGFGMFALALWRLRNLFNFPQGQLGISAPTFTYLVLLAVPASLASINNGQTNLPLSACLALAVVGLLEEKWWFSSLLLTFCLILKPIALASWLLAFAVFPKMRIPLGIMLLPLVGIGFANPNPGYAWSQWLEFANKCFRSYSAENFRASDLFGMLDKWRILTPTWFSAFVRATACFAALFFVWFRKKRRGIQQSAWALWVGSVLVLTIFNPRVETNSYVIISPLLAFAALSYLGEVDSDRWKGAILAVACIGLMCDGMGKPIYLATDVWLKPLIVLLVSPLLFRIPKSWKA